MTVLPAVADPKPGREPRVARSVLGTGLEVLTVRHPGVPLVELRLHIPLPDSAALVKARKQLLGQTMLGGTPHRDAVAIAGRLDELGATLGAWAGADGLNVSGSVLAAHLPNLLELLADVLSAASYPTGHVRSERARLSHQLLLRRSQPHALAAEAFRKRLYGAHPYGLPIPSPGTVGRIGAATLRAQHAAGVSPAGATLVLAGELSPSRATGTLESELSGWTATPETAPLGPPAPARSGPIRVVDKPGAVQTNIRIGGRALPRDDPAYPALTLANLVFGGYFGSRLSANVREDKGYSYSPRSSIDHLHAVSRFAVAADVATEVTAPALVEIRYELSRIATAAVPQDELDKARRFRVGSLVAATQTQAGFASTLSRLAAAGLDASFLRDLPLALAAASPVDVLAAANAHFRPAELVTVMVGDAERILPGLEALDDVDVTS